MVDIESYMHGLKATWVKCLKFSNSVISKLYEKQLKNLGGDLIFKSNISVNNLQNIVPSQFPNNIIKAWALCTCRPKYYGTILICARVMGNHSILIIGTKKEYSFLNTSTTSEVKGFMILIFSLHFMIFLILIF